MTEVITMQLPYVKAFELMLHKNGYDEQKIREYVFFNQRFLDFIDMKEQEEAYHITKSQITTYLLHLVEEFGATHATVARALDALKAYYLRFRRIKINTLENRTIKSQVGKEPIDFRKPFRELQGVTRS